LILIAVIPMTAVSDAFQHIGLLKINEASIGFRG
jgi:hypothetical protein